MTELLSQYNAYLADKLNIDISHLEELYQLFKTCPLYTSFFNSSPSANKTNESSTKAGRCSYELRSGKNKGQPCGSKESVEGSNRCKTHAGKDEVTTTAAKKKTDESVPKVKSVNKFANGISSSSSVVEIPAVKPKEPTKPKKGSNLETMENKEVINLINQRRNDVPIVKNEFNNYVHIGTSLVWDRETMSVSGRQMPNGNVIELSDNDIQLCKINGWKCKEIMKSTKSGSSSSLELNKDIYDISDESEEEDDEDD
jgi:hypothetical protein